MSSVSQSVVETGEIVCTFSKMTLLKHDTVIKEKKSSDTYYEENRPVHGSPVPDVIVFETDIFADLPD